MRGVSIHTMAAIWKFVPDSTVEVCSDGRVRRDGVEFVPSIGGICYRQLYVTGSNKLLHRLIAVAFIPNSEGKPCVDHINGEKLDNKVSNLRWASHSENMRNTRCIMRVLPRGVYGKGKRFEAKIGYDGKRIYLGTYDTPEEASAAYEAKAQELFGEFYNNPLVECHF
jgi:hypothetical protein